MIPRRDNDVLLENVTKVKIMSGIVISFQFPESLATTKRYRENMYVSLFDRDWKKHGMRTWTELKKLVGQRLDRK